ncbi:kinase-like domain-containing protein [Crassisporium funariophilum]|nr:kinase-like domain-containing protein [Crassisporium funariophilum]
MAVLYLPWVDSRYTGHYPDIRDTGQETTEEHLPSASALIAVCTCLQPSDVDQLSNEEILELRKNSSQLHPDSDVAKLTPGTVAKNSQDRDEDAADASEANALDLLFAETTIPVPRVRRVVKRQWDHWIVMDYIPGPTLAHVWGTYSTWRKIRVAFTLRRYVRQLRRLKASATTPPGPLSAQGARICESPPVFGCVRSDRGPFASYSELSDFFNKLHQIVMDKKKVPRDDPSRNDLFDNSEPLVLTHQDLNLRNIIVGEDGRLWIIDWAWAGYYPQWFEFVAMRTQNEDERISGTNDEFWKTLAPFICGPYFRQESWLARMSLGLYLYR